MCHIIKMLANNSNKQRTVALRSSCDVKTRRAKYLKTTIQHHIKRFHSFPGGQTLFESTFRRKARNSQPAKMDFENRSAADQSATTDSSSEQRLDPQDIDRLEGNTDSRNPASADQTAANESSTERVLLTLFTVTPNSTANVNETLASFRRAVLMFWARLESDRLPGMYFGVLDGNNAFPDELVLVEVVQDRDNIGREVSEEERVAEEERRVIQETYHEKHLEVLRTLICHGWLEIGRAVDPNSGQGTEIKERLSDRQLELYGVRL